MQEQTDVRVFIADDHEETVLRMSEFINAASGMKVVGTAADGSALLRYFARGNNGVDVALVDIDMPEMIDGLAVVGKIKNICQNGLKVIVMTGMRGRDYPTDAIRNYADGFVAKYRHKDEFIDAIIKVHKGEMVYLLDPNDIAPPVELPEPLPELTPTELRIVCLMVKGRRNKEIADEIKLGEKNTEKIRGLVMKKLGVQTPAQLGALAEKHGLCR
ncbi:MAG: response regulator transcription factor [Phycisphaerae bacterium]|nr:response regulator transcription factor [Saprospiraceae bacterium]